MRGDRRMLCVEWLWGEIRWDGMGAPWDHTTPKCPLHHGTTVHKHLIHCMRWKIAFRNMWLSTWGPWQDTVIEYGGTGLRRRTYTMCPAFAYHSPDSVLRNQVGYTGPRERTSRRDGRASQEASHRRVVRTWDRPQPYHTRGAYRALCARCIGSIITLISRIL